MGLITEKKLRLYTIIFSMLFSIIFIPLAQSEEFYANIEIEIDESGFVTIDGMTNHPDLIAKNTEVYTLKKQSYWLLNITKEDKFSDYVFELKLPEDASINYIKSSGLIRIEENVGILTVKGFGQNESFSLIVQYQIIKGEDIAFIGLEIFILIIILLLIIVILFFVIITYKKRKTRENASQQVLVDNKHYHEGLSDRQKKIIDLLIERNRPLTQTEIQKDLDIPKAAVSRNINALEIRGLVEREKIGMSNLIRLKKP